jgi:hypothetical protein
MTEYTVHFSPRTSLAAVPLAHQDMVIALIIGYVPWLIVIWFAIPRPSLRIWAGIAVIIPLVALVIVAPRLVRRRDKPLPPCICWTGFKHPLEGARKTLVTLSP